MYIFKFNFRYNHGHNKERDFTSYIHPDTILEDNYVTYNNWTYENHKDWAHKYGFFENVTAFIAERSVFQTYYNIRKTHSCLILICC